MRFVALAKYHADLLMMGTCMSACTLFCKIKLFSPYFQWRAYLSKLSLWMRKLQNI